MATPPLDEGTAKEVLRQVEFYFSDSNIPRDKFLRTTIESSQDGLVSLSLICSFKKMRGYLNLGEAKAEDIPEDKLKAVAETLRKSASILVSEDGKKVGRVNALIKPEEVIEQLDVKTVAASPLGFDVKREDVESFFNQNAKVTSVRLPRHVADKRVFCGTGLIEFSTEEEAQKVMKQELVFQGVQLELKPKKEFDEEREQETKEVESKNKNDTEEDDYPKGVIVALVLKRVAAGGSEKQNGAQQPIKNVSEEDRLNLENSSEENKPEESTDTPADEDKTGVIVEKGEKIDNDVESEEVMAGEDKSSEVLNEKDEKRMKNLNPEDCKDNMNIVLREDLKHVFEKFGTVKYVDFKIGETKGYIRFEQPEATQQARKAAVAAPEGGLSVKNFIATLEPVTGNAEREYWDLCRANQEKHRVPKGGRGRGGKRSRGGGKHFRYRDNSGTGRPSKAQKV